MCYLYSWRFLLKVSSCDREWSEGDTKKVSKSFYGLKTQNTGELLHGLKSYDQVPVVRKHLPSD